MAVRKRVDFWLALGLFLLLLVMTSLAAVQQTRNALSPPLSSLSAAPDGARALRLWLAELGYSVDDTPLDRFLPPPQAALIFMLEPFTGVTEQEWAALDAWVEAGGTLVLAGNQFGSQAALRHYGFRLTWLNAESLTAPTPLLARPPLPAEVAVSTTAALHPERDDYVIHLAAGNQPALVSFAQGDGRVFVSATVAPFSNVGLKEGDNGLVALNLISAAGRETARSAVWFNEWHHGRRGTEASVAGPGDWLRRTPSGQALLYTAAVVFVALILRGRRFGRPIPVAGDNARRAPLEYITALANMKRRAGHRTAVLAHYHHQLKRSLGHRYRLSPNLPDAAFVTQLAAYNPTLDAAALLDLLSRLRQPGVSEREMVELAAATGNWIKR
jgi:hypothetical protein